MRSKRCCVIFFFFNDTATTEIYTLSLHDALPISFARVMQTGFAQLNSPLDRWMYARYCSGVALTSQASRIFHPRGSRRVRQRSEEHTSELQSPCNLVCRLLLEKKKTALPYRPGSA